MTVKELIEELQKLPQDKRVEIECEYDFGFGVAGGYQIEISERDDRVTLLNNEFFDSEVD